MPYPARASNRPSPPPTPTQRGRTGHAGISGSEETEWRSDTVSGGIGSSDRGGGDSERRAKAVKRLAWRKRTADGREQMAGGNAGVSA